MASLLGALLVDDDVEWLDILGEHMLRAGLAVVWASNPQRALRYVAEPSLRGLLSYKVAVVDLHLDPRLGVEAGEQVIRSVSDRYPDCAILAVSGLLSVAEMRSRLTDVPGVSGYFVKNPFPISEFEALLGEVIDSPEQVISKDVDEERLYRPNIGLLTAQWQELGIAEELDRPKLFESFSQLLFSSIALFTCIGERRHTASGEIDLVFEVRCIPGTLTQDWDSLVLVECKSSRNRVSAKEVASFAQKLRNARLSTGVLAAAGGVTGRGGRAGAAQIRNLFQREGIRILVVDAGDMERVVSGSASLYAILRQRSADLRLIS